jgi:hypothetical protein
MSTEEEEPTRKEILETREAHKKLADIVLAGTQHCEPVTVKTVDGKEHPVDVYALSEKDLTEAFQEAGQDLRDVGNQGKILDNLKLMGALAARATRQPNIVSLLMPMQSAPIALKTLEMSGLVGGARSPK